MTKNYETIDYMFPEEELRKIFPTSQYSNYLYHYTDLAAILSIIKNREIWLFAAASLNDTSEGMLLYKELIKIADSKQVRDNIIEAHTLLTKNTYISSFSIFGNLLTLWRGYGDIAIGFDFWELQSKRIIEDRNSNELVTSGLSTPNCTYNTHEIKKYAKDLIARYEKNAAQDVRQLLALGSLYFGVKHPAFLDEREVRMVCYLYDREPFIHDNGKKYIKYKFKNQAIQRIVFGPSASEEDIQKVSQQISKHKELNHIKMYKSTIPFVGR
ncbi:MAG: hypothetical protein GY755_14165 [Chloroflexi bacterium]|nr:hypothetical protein [Chloroflexota bacterium]